MNSKAIKIIEGFVISILGVLVAIFGGGQVLDIYLGVVSTVLGVTYAALAIVGLSQKKVLDFSYTILASIFVFIGIFIFVKVLTFAMLINVLLVVLMGIGTGLVILGAYALTKKALVFGIGQIVVGALFIVFTALYLANIEGFQKVFWIVIGIVIALYGILVIVNAVIEKKK